MMHVLHTTPVDPVVMAIGVVTELSPDEQMTGIFTAREIEYAAASVGVAYSFPICQANSLINAKFFYEVKHRPISSIWTSKKIYSSYAQLPLQSLFSIHTEALIHISFCILSF